MEENTNVVENAIENVGELTVVQKEGFGTKIVKGAKKVFSSKPAKIIGGVLLAAGGAVVGYSYANRDKNDYDSFEDDEDFYDEDEFDMPEEEIPDTQVND